MNRADQVPGVVRDVINRVLTDSGREARHWDDDDVLTENVGLDSLDLAVMVVGLEDRLGVDPFRAGARPVRTLGELVKLYQATVEPTA